MPWVTVTCTADVDADAVAGAVRTALAAALGLTPDDVLAQVVVAHGSAAPSAIAVIRGRDRSPDAVRAGVAAVAAALAASRAAPGPSCHATWELSVAGRSSSGAEVTVVPPPAVTGAPGLTQGPYGLRGNLELVVPDPVDGLWVLWHNADPEGTPPADPPAGALPGRWSGGLRFGVGRRYEAASILCSTHGPHWLEVLARSGHELVRLVWSPDDGFVEREVVLHGVAGRVAVTEDDTGALHAWAPRSDGRLAHRIGRATTYPLLDWADAPAPDTGPAAVTAVAALHTDRRSARAVVACVAGAGLLAGVADEHGGTLRPVTALPPDAAVHAVALAASGPEELHLLATDGHTAHHLVGDGTAWELTGTVPLEPPIDDLTLCCSSAGGAHLVAVARSGSGLQHAELPLPAAGHRWSPARPVRSEVWTPPGGAPIHRR